MNLSLGAKTLFFLPTMPSGASTRADNPMDNRQLLQRLRDLDLEGGRCLIMEHASVMDDPAAFGVLLAAEALDQVFANPATSLRLAELLIFLGKHCQDPSSHALGLKA